MNVQRTVSLALLASLALSGCFDSSGTDTDQEDAEPEVPGPGGTFTNSTGPPPVPGCGEDGAVACPTLEPHVSPFVECMLAVGIVDIPSDEVQAALPEGYEVNDRPLVPSFESVNVRFHECESFVLDNGTVVSPFRWVETLVGVEVNESMRDPEAGDVYVWEILADNASVVQALQESGMNAILADIGFELEAATFTATVAVDGAPWYTMTTAFVSTDTIDMQVRNRLHHAAPDPSWIDQYLLGVEAWASQGTVEVSGGVLATFPSSGAGILANIGTTNVVPSGDIVRWA